MAFDPVSIGLQAGGALLQFISNQQADKAMMRAYQAHRAAQNRLQNEGRAAFDVSLAGIDPRLVEALRAARYGDTAAAAAPISATDYGPAGGNADAPASVGRAVQRRIGAGARESERNARATADVGSGGDFLEAANRRHGVASEKIGTTQDFMRGNLAILPGQISAADAKRKNMIADLMMAGGQIVGGLGGLKGLFGGPTNIVPSAMGAPQTFTVGTPFTPRAFAPMPAGFGGIY